MYNNAMAHIDPEIYAALALERTRQQQHLELIASENYAPREVLELAGSILTNKYAEGYPGKRYYGGCEHVDTIESLAIDRAKKLFKAEYVNVQPHSGSSANLAVMLALLNTGDTILGMDLNHGGHLTHGSKVSYSGKIYNSVSYGVSPDTGLIDYDKVEELTATHKPKMLIAGFSAYSRVIDWKAFADIAKKHGAILLADMAHVAGLIAVDEYPSPIPFADIVTTTTHKTLRGPRGGMILAKDDSFAKKLNSGIFPGSQGGPMMHIIAAKAACFLAAMQPEFKQYQRQVKSNAKLMSEIFMQRGHDLVGHGTDNHLLLLNLMKKQLTGKFVETQLGLANITVNKNSVPNDVNNAQTTSGIRIGTPAVTTRGFKEKEISAITNWICDILEDPNNTDIISKVKTQVIDLCAAFPLDF